MRQAYTTGRINQDVICKQSPFPQCSRPVANSSYNDQVVLKKFTKFGPSRHSIAPLLVPRFALLLPLQLPSRFFVALESKSLVAQTWNPKDIRACPQKLVIVPAHPSFFFLQRKKSNAPVKTAWINRRQKSLICSFVTSIQTHIVSTAPSESSSPSSLSIYRFAGLARKRLFPPCNPPQIRTRLCHRDRYFSSRNSKSQRFLSKATTLPSCIFVIRSL